MDKKSLHSLLSAINEIFTDKDFNCINDLLSYINDKKNNDNENIKNDCENKFNLIDKVEETQCLTEDDEEEEIQQIYKQELSRFSDQSHYIQETSFHREFLDKNIEESDEEVTTDSQKDEIIDQKVEESVVESEVCNHKTNDEILSPEIIEIEGAQNSNAVNLMPTPPEVDSQDTCQSIDDNLEKEPSNKQDSIETINEKNISVNQGEPSSSEQNTSLQNAKENKEIIPNNEVETRHNEIIEQNNVETDLETSSNYETDCELVIDEASDSSTNDSEDIVSNKPCLKKDSDLFSKKDLNVKRKINFGDVTNERNVRSKYFSLNQKDLKQLSSADSIEKTRKYIKKFLSPSKLKISNEESTEPLKFRKKVKLRQRDKPSTENELSFDEDFLFDDNQNDQKPQNDDSVRNEIMTFNKSKGSYSTDEDLKILKFIIHYQRYADIKGNQLWKEMEEKHICFNRSWQSMKERFRKSIIGNLSFYTEVFPITPLQMEYLQSNINFVPRHLKAQTSVSVSNAKPFGNNYSMEEDEGKVLLI